MSIALYDSCLQAGGDLLAREAGGSARLLELPRWRGGVDAADSSLLERATGPALDVGCGPGRIVTELLDTGVAALGIDVSPAAVLVTRRRGGLAILRSVFDPVPLSGSWGSVLLVDGNIGIGGDPRVLLERCVDLLRPGGRLLVELSTGGVGRGALDLRLETAGGERGSWFRWAEVGAADLPPLAATTSTRVVETWVAGGRWFAELQRCELQR